MLARTHKTMIWERTREVQRLRHQLREYFSAALEAFDDLDAPDVLELLAKAPDPERARKLTRAQVSAALKRARRRNIPDKATAVLAALRSGQLAQPPALTAAYAATVRALIAVITALNEQVKLLEDQVGEHFGRHPDAEDLPVPARDRCHPRCPGARRVRRRPRPLPRRQGQAQLRRHQPDHPRLRKEKGRHGPVRPQRPAR